MKDFKSILLALLSIGLIGTWFYHFYEKSKYETDIKKTYIRDSASIAQTIKNILKDSVQKTEIVKTDSSINSDTDTITRTDPYVDSLKARLDNSLTEVINLKKQIDDILKNDQATQSDLTKSKELIADLNNKIEKLKSENQLLQARKTQANSTQQKDIAKIKEPTPNSIKTGFTKKDSTFTVTNINLSTVNTLADNKDGPSSNEADKLNFSFTLHNNALNDSYYDVYIVIITPENKILQADQWAAAENFFNSKTEGTKAFTKRIRIEYNRGDQKRIMSSVEPERISKGVYTLKIYLNGVVIGQTKRSIG
jgi:hypothetical protein